MGDAAGLMNIQVLEAIVRHAPVTGTFASGKSRIRAAIAVLFLAAYPFSVSAQVKVCEVKLAACAESFNRDTIPVASNVVALSSQLHACWPTIVIESDGVPRPPAIMFVIDQSGSMTGTRGNDATGARYTILSAFLDSLYKNTPDAEVGVAIFKTTLWLDRTTGQYYTAYFKPLPTVVSVGGVPVPDQSYLQLITLNKTYATTAGAKVGIDIIKEVVATSPVTGGADLTYRPNFTDPCGVGGVGDCSSFNGETNYNIGFDAARAAFAATTIPKERQFIIFFTDGEPNQPWSMETSANVNYFQQGINVPTTFSVYFTDNANPPQSLVTMTNAIRVNGYSAVNDSSNYWAMQASHDALMNLLMNNIFHTLTAQEILGMTQMFEGTPLTMTMKGATSSLTNDTAFVFPNDFPLNPGVNTFKFQTNYNFKDLTTGATWDTTIIDSFYVKRDGRTAPIVTGTSINCSDVSADVSVDVQASPNPVTAGAVSTLTASILPVDLYGNADSDLAQAVTWRLVSPTPGDTLIGNRGPTVQVSGTRAFRSIRVIATLFDSVSSTSTYDTALVFVNAAADFKVYVEKTSTAPLADQADALPKTFVDSVVPRPIEVVMLDSSTNMAYVYALVRDQYGNIKRLATSASWDMLQPADAGAIGSTPGKPWEGVVARFVNVGEDSLRVWESSLSPERGDTVHLVFTNTPNTGVVTEITPVDRGSGAQAPDESRSGCGCGAGVGLAFVPPIFFKVGAMRRRRKRIHAD